MKNNISDFNSSVGGWFSDLGNNISSKFNEWKEERQKEKEERKKEKEEEKKQEEEQKQSNENKMNDISDNVNGVVSDKFKSFYTLKDFLVEFWNAISESGEEVPEFNITLPDAFGGGTYNILDLRFYNQYRSYIHGIIAGICYFVYIKKLYHNLPNVIK